MVKCWTISSCCTILYQTLMVVLLIGLCPGSADTAPTMFMTSLTLIQEEYSWNTGLALCGKGYGSLLNVLDQTMQNVLVQMHSVLQFGSDMWIGLHLRGLDSTNEYYWSNCQPLQSHWTNWNSKPLSTSNKLCVLLSQRFLTWYTESCWKGLQTLCAKSQGTCTYELKEEQTCSLDVPKKSVNATTLVDCEELCNTEVNGGNVCWAYIFHRDYNTCQLIFGSNPYFCENDVERNEKCILGLRRCFNFSRVSLVGAEDSEIDDPLLTCPESTSSGAATTTFTTSLDKDTIATPPSYSTITDMSSPDTSTMVSSISDQSTTASSAPRTSTTTRSSSDTSTTGRPFPDTSTTTTSSPGTTATTRSSPDTSTTGRSFPETSTTTRSTPDASTTTASSSDTTTTTTSSPDTSTTGRSSPDTTTTTTSSSDTSTTVRSSSDTSTTTTSSDTTTTDRSSPDTSTTAFSASPTSSTNSTPATIVLSSMPTPGVSQGAPNETVTSRANAICSCMCLSINKTGSLQSFNDLLENLLLDKRSLSAYRRKHESAGDDRPSAKSLGVGEPPSSYFPFFSSWWLISPGCFRAAYLALKCKPCVETSTKRSTR